MANNIVAIEEVPQYHPAFCCFNGNDRATSKWFIRVVNPDLETDTLLIGEPFFHEMAKRVGYVKLEEIDKAKKTLEEELVNVTVAIDNLTSELSTLATSLASLDAIEKRVADLRKIVSAAGSLVKKSAESTGTTPDK